MGWASYSFEDQLDKFFKMNNSAVSSSKVALLSPKISINRGDKSLHEGGRF